MTALLKTDNSWAQLFIRLLVAVVIFPHGAQKLLGWFGGRGFSATLAGMTGMGIPAVVVLMIIAAESIGALMIAAGFLTRIAAGGLLLVMLGAIVIHWPYGFFMNWGGKNPGEGFEYHLLVVGIAASLVVAGAGRLSVDRWLSERLGKRQREATPAAAA